jgi:hypothetical protein
MVADQSSEVISSSAKVKPRRRPGAKVNLKGKIRRGEDRKAAISSVRDQVGTHLGNVGIPASKIKVKLSEADPRSGEKRVN